MNDDERREAERLAKEVWPEDSLDFMAGVTIYAAACEANKGECDAEEMRWMQNFIKLESDLKAECARSAKLIEALAWYAEFNEEGTVGDDVVNLGEVARQAIGEYEASRD